MSLVKNSDSASELSSGSRPSISVPRRRAPTKYWRMKVKVKGRGRCRGKGRRSVKRSPLSAAIVSEFAKDLGYDFDDETIQRIFEHVNDVLKKKKTVTEAESDSDDGDSDRYHDAPEGSNILFCGRIFWTVDEDGRKRRLWPVPVKLIARGPARVPIYRTIDLNRKF
ncbi:hypothetical protein AgCh_033174 [Apium graveolens]